MWRKEKVKDETSFVCSNRHEMCSSMCWWEYFKKTSYRSSARNTKGITCFVRYVWPPFLKFFFFFFFLNTHCFWEPMSSAANCSDVLGLTACSFWFRPRGFSVLVARVDFSRFAARRAEHHWTCLSAAGRRLSWAGVAHMVHHVLLGGRLFFSIGNT